MSEIEQRIAEMILNCDDVKEKHCKLLKDLNTPHSALENRKICAECRAKAILALIASEQQPMVEALQNMCYQFAYDGHKDGKSCVCTGGLSPLEDAFEVLGWDNPHFVEEIPFKDIRGAA